MRFDARRHAPLLIAAWWAALTIAAIAWRILDVQGQTAAVPAARSDEQSDRPVLAVNPGRTKSTVVTDISAGAG
jgi:hypothetical protein